MNDLAIMLRTEWLKVRYFRPFWVLFWLYPICLGGIVAVLFWGQMRVQEMAQGSAAAGPVSANLPFAYPLVWHTVAYTASWIHFIPALLLILNVTNEFQFRTHRQNLLEGWSRPQFLFSKLLLALGISLFCTFTALLSIVVAGAVSKTLPTREGAEYLARFFLQTFTYQVVALLFAFVVRRAALAIAAFLLYTSMLEAIAAFAINAKSNGYGDYLPLRVANGLVPTPYVQDHAPAAAREFLAGLPLQVSLAASVLYLSLFVGFLVWRFRREDL